MAEDEDGFLNLSFPQKLQLGVFGAGTLIFLLTYLTAGLPNGFNYVNTWILDNPIPVAAYWSLNIGMIPVYRRADPTEWKSSKRPPTNSSESEAHSFSSGYTTNSTRRPPVSTESYQISVG
jgi:hypothetical protein